MEPTVYVWLLLVGLSTSALGYPTRNSHSDTSLAASKLNPSLAQFTLNLYKQLSSASSGKNIFFSPISIAATLSALSLGARSTTRTQILEGLSFNISEIQEKEIHEGFHDLAFNLSCASDQIQMDLGQALFLRENVTFKQTFLDDVHAFYEADITSAKFQKPKEAEKQINDYVERKTHGKITQLVKDLGPDTTLVAINYIFFKGNWKIPFNPKRTTERDFFVDEKTAIKVPMMYQAGWFDIYFDRKRSCTVLRLEYNDSASAFFVLPERGKDKQLEDALTLDTLTEWQGRLYRDVGHIYIPKFEISTCYKLKEALHNLHITDVFSDSADLSGITEEISLKVTKVIHKAFVSIDERGTTASAATAAVVFPQYSDVEAEFNRPFLLFIVDSRNTILFFGKIANPERNEAGANSSPAAPE